MQKIKWLKLEQEIGTSGFPFRTKEFIYINIDNISGVDITKNKTEIGLYTREKSYYLVANKYNLQQLKSIGVVF